MRNRCSLSLFLLLLLSVPERSFAVESFQQFNDIQYATADNHRLLLDLYLPKVKQQPPLLVWIHGGAWRAGSKANMPLIDLVKQGFAVASVDYRLSPVAKFPAQIY
ncbi:MAG TPA: lipase, partial [Planctomycetaceae bacterium]|nr:lipase [Planctomycetaceae bacterium]